MNKLRKLMPFRHVLFIIVHAYLITGGSKESRLTSAEQIAGQKGAKLVDFPAQKISDIRKLNHFLALSPQIKTAIVLDISTSTTEALNALLKNLEEKVAFTFILMAGSQQAVLPTIVSRCEVISLTRKDDDKKREEIEKFLSMPLPQKLEYVSDIKSRSDALEFLDEIIFVLRDQLESSKSKHIVKNIKTVLLAKKYLSANTNVFLQLTNFAISLDE